MTERTIRQATHTYDGRDAAQRIEQLEDEILALRAEVARLRSAEASQRAAFVSQVEAEMRATVKELR